MFIEVPGFQIYDGRKNPTDMDRKQNVMSISLSL